MSRLYGQFNFYLKDAWRPLGSTTPSSPTEYIQVDFVRPLLFTDVIVKGGEADRGYSEQIIVRHSLDGENWLINNDVNTGTEKVCNYFQGKDAVHENIPQVC